MNRTVTIVGASARAAAQSAARGGFSVHAADLFADLDLRSLCDARAVTDYPRGLATIVGGPQPGGWLYTGALENHPALVERLARLRPLWGNSAKVLRRVRQPRRWTTALGAAGLRVPQIEFEAAVLPRDGSWLQKPLRSAAGARIAPWDRHANAVAMGPCYFQRRIDGDPCSAVYLAARGQCVLWGITRQLIGAAWTGASGFHYCGSIGPRLVSPEIAEGFAQIGSVLAQEFNLLGLFGVDAMVNAEGVWPVEINPRYTASVEMLDWATGLSAIDLHVETCSTGRLPQTALARSGRSYGKAIVFAHRRVVVPSTSHWIDNTARGDDWPKLADIPAPESVIEPGWPIVTVLAEEATEREVLARLRQRAAEVRASIDAQAVDTLMAEKGV